MGLEKKTRRPPRTPQHNELKPETHEKGPPVLEPTREERTKRSRKATKGPEDHPKTSRRNTRGREREIEDAASEINEGRQEEQPVAKGTTMRSKERMPREKSLQRRKKPHREDKSSTEADDEAQPRENKAQTIVPGMGPQPEVTGTNS